MYHPQQRRTASNADLEQLFRDAVDEVTALDGKLSQIAQVGGAEQLEQTAAVVQQFVSAYLAYSEAQHHLAGYEPLPYGPSAPWGAGNGEFLAHEDPAENAAIWRELHQH